MKSVCVPEMRRGDLRQNPGQGALIVEHELRQFFAPPEQDTLSGYNHKWLGARMAGCESVCEVTDLHAKIGQLTVETDFLSHRPKR